MAVALQSSVALAQPGRQDVLTSPMVPFNLSSARGQHTLSQRRSARHTNLHLLAVRVWLCMDILLAAGEPCFLTFTPAGSSVSIIAHFLSPTLTRHTSRGVANAHSIRALFWTQIAPDGLSNDANFVSPLERFPGYCSKRSEGRPAYWRRDPR